jgi:hypothetical protein
VQHYLSNNSDIRRQQIFREEEILTKLSLHIGETMRVISKEEMYRLHSGALQIQEH